MKKNIEKKKKFNFFGYSPLIIVISVVLLAVFFLTGGKLFQPAPVENINSFFSDKTEAITGDNNNQNTTNFTVFDYDRDGTKEVFVTNFKAKNYILKWDKDKFSRIDSSLFSPEPNYIIDSVSCDFDGDGVEEIFLSAGDLENNEKKPSIVVDYVNNKWEDRTQKYLTNLQLANGRDVICSDIDGDHKFELIQIDKFSQIRILSFDKQKQRFDEISGKAGLNKVISNGDTVLTMPYLGKYQDLIISNKQLGNTFFKNNGKGVFTKFDIGPDFTNISTDTSTLNVLDINHDQKLDLLLGNYNSNQKLLVQNKDNILEKLTSDKFNSQSNINSFVVADFDLNGIDDILTLSEGGKNTLFAGIPGGYDTLSIGHVEEEGGNSKVGLAVDFTNSGLIDLLIGSKDRPLKFFNSFKTNSNWITIRAVTKNGAYARGASIRLKTSLGTQIKLVDNGSGFVNNDGDMLFGLANATKVESIEVLFPDGQIKNIQSPDIKKLLVVKAN